MNDTASFLQFLASLSPQQWAVISTAAAGSVGAFCSFMSLTLGILGNRYPSLLKWAMKFSSVGARLHPLGNEIGSLLPGGVPTQLATLKSMAPRPSLIEMCPTCGGPVTAPAAIRTGANQ